MHSEWMTVDVKILVNKGPGKLANLFADGKREVKLYVSAGPSIRGFRQYKSPLHDLPNHYFLPLSVPDNRNSS